MEDLSWLPDQPGSKQQNLAQETSDTSWLPDQPLPESPSYFGAFKTGLKAGGAGAAGFYEKLLPTPIDYPLKATREYLTPSEEEMANVEKLGIPGQVALGVGELPGAIAKYGPPTAVAGLIPGVGPIVAGAIGMGGVEAIEALPEGPVQAAKRGAMGAVTGGVLGALGPVTKAVKLPTGEIGKEVIRQGLPRYVKAPIMGGMFAGQALIEGAKPEEAIAPAIIGAGLGAIHGKGPEKGIYTKVSPITEPQYRLAPGWYSNLERTLQMKMANFAPPEQIKNMLKGAGVKEDEMKWSGMEDFLSGKTKVSKSELLDYVKENQVEVREIVKGQLKKRFELRGTEGKLGVWDTEQNGWRITPDSFLPTEQNFNHVAGRVDALNFRQYESTGTKFSQWQLPGGENYREMVFSLPNIEPGFKSTHFPEVKNPVAHTRFNDRIDSEGKKVLFLEEVQSDWHQAGREQGYKKSLEQIINELPKEFDDKRYIGSKLVDAAKGRGFTGGELDRLRNDVNSWLTENKPIPARFEYKAIFSDIGAEMEGVPPAPFSKTWHEMAMRRMVREAAEKGYDRIEWTTGEQQAARYDLSKQIDELGFSKHPTSPQDNFADIWALKKGQRVIEERVPLNELDRWVGKDMARKILEDPKKSGEFSGLDLKVGGEGMKGFYDKIIPEYMNKFGKKWGVKVQELKLPKYTDATTGERWQVLDDNMRPMGTYGTREQAQWSADHADLPSTIRKMPDEFHTVHSFDITPSMRESVLKEGMPLFRSVTGHPAITPLSSEQVLSVVDKRTSELKNSPRVMVAESSVQFPEHLKAKGATAVYDPDSKTIWIARDRMGSERDVLYNINHEAVGHYALNEFLGNNFESFLNRVVMRYGVRSLQEEMDALGYKFDLSTKEGRMSAAREKVAMLAETGENPTLLRQIYSRIRTALSKIFPDMEITDDEIRTVLARAKGKMESGKFGTGGLTYEQAIRESDARVKRVRDIEEKFRGKEPEYRMVATAFAKEDLIPAAVQTQKGFKDSLKWITNVLVPTMGVPRKGLEAVHTYLGGIMRAREYFDLAEVVGDQTLGKVTRMFDSMPADQVKDFINKAMRGEPQSNRFLDKVRDFFQANDTQLWGEIEGRGGRKGQGIGWVENHFRLWLKPGSTDEQVKAFSDYMLKRKLPGTMGWDVKRFFSDLHDAEVAGFELAVKNPAEMWKLSYADQLQWIQFHDMKEQLMRDGYLKKLEVPEPGFVKTTENLSNIWFSQKGEGWYIEEGIGRILNNYLSRDRLREIALGRTIMSIKNHTTMMEFALSLFHGSTITNEAISSGMGEAARRMWNVGIGQKNAEEFGKGITDMIKAPLTPVIAARLGGGFKKFFSNREEFLKTVRGQEFIRNIPNADEMLDLLWDAGGRFGMSEDYKLNSLKTFREAVGQKNYIGAIIRSVPALNAMLMKPLFQEYIPRVKVGLWLRETMAEIGNKSEDIIAGRTSKWDIAYDKWRFVEARFGEMSFDNEFWNKTFKTGMMMMIRSVTWQVGNLRAFGNAIVNQSKEITSAMRQGRFPQLTPEAAWTAAVFATTATMGYIAQKVFTGKDPESWQDYFYPQVDEEGNRVSMPSYARVGFHMVHSPLKYAKGTFAGWFGRFLDVINNKDFYGTQVHDPEENMIFQRVDDLIHLVPLPFSVTTQKQMRASGAPMAEQLLGYLGATKAPYWIQRTAAESLASDIAGRHLPAGGLTKEQRAKTDLIKTYVREFRDAEKLGKPTDMAIYSIQNAVSEGKLDQNDLIRIRQRLIRQPLEQSIMRLTLSESLQVWEKATPEEKMRISPYIMRKFGRSRSETERQEAIPKIGEMAEFVSPPAFQ